MAIAKSLLRQGFRRQVYLAYHGPAAMTISAVARDFFDETGVPILLPSMANFTHKYFLNPDGSYNMDVFDDLFIGAYEIMGCLEDVPLTTQFHHDRPQSCSHLKLAQGGGSCGFYFAEDGDHGSTASLPDAATRKAHADRGVKLIQEWVEDLDAPGLVASLRELDEYNQKVMQERPWTPAAFNNR